MKNPRVVAPGTILVVKRDVILVETGTPFRSRFTAGKRFLVKRQFTDGDLAVSSLTSPGDRYSVSSGQLRYFEIIEDLETRVKKSLEQFGIKESNPLPYGFQVIPTGWTAQGFKASLYGPAFIVIAKDDPVIGAGYKSSTLEEANRFANAYHDPRHQWAVKFKDNTLLGHFYAPTQTGAIRKANQKARKWNASLDSAHPRLRDTPQWRDWIRG